MFTDDHKALNIVLIEPIALDRSKRVVVKQNSINFTLTNPISEYNFALLYQPTCIFDVGETTGQFQKREDFLSKHLNFLTQLSCLLPKSITKNTVARTIHLQRLKVGPLIQSIDHEIEIVFLGSTKVSNPWLPRFVELGELLDFTRVFQNQALSDVQGECLFHISGEVISNPFKNLSCTFPTSFGPGLDLRED